MCTLHSQHIALHTNHISSVQPVARGHHRGHALEDSALWSKMF